jgi:hypothetical protein
VREYRNQSCSAMLMDVPVSHLCFMQLCGITSSSKIHAAVFHDGAAWDFPKASHIH